MNSIEGLLLTTALRRGYGNLPPKQPQFGNATQSAIVKIVSHPEFAAHLEDIIAFGVVRTVFNTFRMYFFKSVDAKNKHINLPATREWGIREIGNQFSANFLSGLSFIGLARWARRSGPPHISDQFASNDTLILFRHLMEKVPEHSQAPSAAFIQGLSKTIAGSGTTEQQHSVQRIVQQAFDTATHNGNAQKQLEQAAVRLATTLKQKDFQIQRVVAGEALQLNLHNLLGDSSQFFKAIPKSASWKQTGTELLQNTQRVKHWMVPLALGIGMMGTMLVPYVNKELTKWLSNIDDHVGEMGLRELKKVDHSTKKGWFRQAFPYVGRQWHYGDIKPLLISLIPLPFALGVFDNGALHNGEWRKAVNLPFTKGFLKRAYNMFQFRPGFPFMTAHQLLALCALVCTARILTARDKIEMRERLVDSYGGWAVWAVGFGMLKKGLARMLDNRYGSRLLEKTPSGVVMRSSENIRYFMSKTLAEKTLKAQKFLKWTSTGILIAVIGIVEPYIALKWTEHQVREQQRRQILKLPPKPAQGVM